MLKERSIDHPQVACNLVEAECYTFFPFHPDQLFEAAVVIDNTYVSVKDHFILQMFNSAIDAVLPQMQVQYLWLGYEPHHQ